uniref:Interleukin-1 beta n=1 Tax=Gasterosteus aculeatus aculeatus TaxID=481459 RepID=A0AAQ4QPX8_GASAC
MKFSFVCFILYSSSSNDTGCESRCFNMTEVREEIVRLDEGLELQVSRDPRTLQMVTTVVMAVTRMKRSLGHRRLSSDALCSAIMESLVTETVVTTTGSSSMQPFHRVNSEEVCTLSDVSHKDVICPSGGTILQAMVLKGGHSDRKGTSNLSPTDGTAVLLSVTNSNRHISCSCEGGTVVLKLEVRQTDRQTDRSTSRDTHIQTHRQIDRERDKQRGI